MLDAGHPKLFVSRPARTEAQSKRLYKYLVKFEISVSEGRRFLPAGMPKLRAGDGISLSSNLSSSSSFGSWTHCCRRQLRQPLRGVLQATHGGRQKLPYVDA